MQGKGVPIPSILLGKRQEINPHSKKSRKIGPAVSKIIINRLQPETPLRSVLDFMSGKVNVSGSIKRKVLKHPDNLVINLGFSRNQKFQVFMEIFYLIPKITYCEKSRLWLYIFLNFYFFLEKSLTSPIFPGYGLEQLHKELHQGCSGVLLQGGPFHLTGRQEATETVSQTTILNA